MREAAGATTKTSLLHTWTMDARRGPDLPADGAHARLTQELAFGGDAHFHKLSGEVRYGQPLWPGTRLSVGATAGILQALGGTKTFFSDRFQLGGPVSVRSFRTNGMGPRDGCENAARLFCVVLMTFSQLTMSAVTYSGRRVQALFRIYREEHTGLLKHKCTSMQGGLTTSTNVGTFSFLSFCSDTDCFLTAKPLLDSLVAALTKPSVSVGLGLVYRFDPIRIELNFGMPLIAAKSDASRRGFQVGIGLDFL